MLRRAPRLRTLPRRRPGRGVHVGEEGIYSEPEARAHRPARAAGAQRRALAEHARFVDENLKRNYTANFIHGVLGMTGFRLIYAPDLLEQRFHPWRFWRGLGRRLRGVHACNWA